MCKERGDCINVLSQISWMGVDAMELELALELSLLIVDIHSYLLVDASTGCT